MTQLLINFRISPRSMVSINQAKSDIIEWWFRYYQNNGVPFRSTADLIEHKFNMTEKQYFAKSFTEDDRIFYYKIKSSYSNHVKI